MGKRSLINLMRTSLFAGLVLAAGCATTEPVDLVEGGPCETEVASLSADFPAAGMAACGTFGPSEFYVLIGPEKAPPINPSPWYAVKLDPKQPGTVRVTLKYSEYEHRYQPKISTDLSDWSYVDPRKVRVGRTKSRVSVNLTLGTLPVYLAGQEIFANQTYDAWYQWLERQSGIQKNTIGNSVDGREIVMFSSLAESDQGDYVLFVGRQHPPEVTGALTMVPFIETIMADTPLATEFRNRFNILMVPNMNPDGVEYGHWRLNVNGIDLNRDWGPFTQPETQAVKSVLDGIATDEDKNLLLFFDFHSTKRNVFYTQTVEDEPTPYDFTGNWLENARARLPDYDFERAERHNSDLATSKNYVNGTFQIPAITFETGDETDRQAIKESAPVFAEEMMKLLLQNHP